MKIKNENDNMENIGRLLINDKENIPLHEKLDITKLDLSITSLKEIDRYLEVINKNKRKLSNEEIKKIILRTGVYLGEVIRKSNKKIFIWLSYDEAFKLNKYLINYDKDILTGFVLYNLDTKEFWFPLAKAYKFIEYGKSDSLWAFAKVCLDKDKKLKI